MQNFQNIAARMEVRVLRTSASIWLHITHYHTIPSCLQARPSHWPAGPYLASHWPSSAGHLVPVPDSESEIPGAGREAREAMEATYAAKVMLKVGLETRCLGPGPAATTRIVLSA